MSLTFPSALVRPEDRRGPHEQVVVAVRAGAAPLRYGEEAEGWGGGRYTREGKETHEKVKKRGRLLRVFDDRISRDVMCARV